MKTAFAPLVAPLSVIGAMLCLAACDQPKPRPAPPPEAALAAAPSTATPAAQVAASTGLTKRPEMAGFSLDVINEAQDPVNRPASITADAPVAMSGFGFDPVTKAPGAAVDIVIDGVAYPTTYGAMRGDVAAYFKTPGLDKTGFTVTLPAGTIKAGPHQAIVRVVAADRSGYFDSVTIGFVAK